MIPDFIEKKICPYCSKGMNVKEHEGYFGFYCPHCTKGGSIPKMKEKKKIKKVDLTVCSCGGKIITKDHDGWIGWFCTKCKAGGSKDKPKQKQWRKR